MSVAKTCRSLLSSRLIFHCQKRLDKNIISKRFMQTINEDDHCLISISQIKRTLNQHDVQYSDGFACIVASDCPLKCQDRQRDKKFYVNKTTGFLVCQACGHTGPWSWLEQRLSERSKHPPIAPATIPIETSPDLYENCHPVATASTFSVEKCLEQLNLSHVPIVTLAELGACYDENRLLLPLKGGPHDAIGAWTCITAPVEKSTRPQEQLIGLKGASVSTSPLLLTKSSTWNSKEAVIVPTAADLLALASKNISTICLPAGSRHLPQEVLPSLEHFEKLTLWFGEHSGSAPTFALKLGVKRCFMVRPLEDVSGAHEMAVSLPRRKSLLSATVDAAQPMSHPAITTFSALRNDVRSQMERADLALGVPWKRFPRLTSILGGFRRGEVTVLTGPTGSGKTTFMSEYSLDLCLQGVNTLWGSFEIRNTRLARTLLTQLAGEKLETNLKKFEKVADELETLPLYFMDFHGHQPLSKVMEVVRLASYVHDVAHVIIDNVQFMLGLGSEGHNMDKFYRQDMVIDAFRQHATTANCHITLIIHPRKELPGELLSISSIYGSAKATQEADNVIILQDQSSAGGRRFLQVVKNRYSGQLGAMTLEFDEDSVSFSKKRKTFPKIQPGQSASFISPSLLQGSVQVYPKQKQQNIIGN